MKPLVGIDLMLQRKKKTKQAVTSMTACWWRHVVIAVGLVFLLGLGHPSVCRAESDYEFVLFGVNLKSLKESNWLTLAIGGFTSYMVHELGHVLYLKSQGKDWEVQGPNSSGLSVYTSSELDDTQWRNFGRAGFALQSGIGIVLTSFDTTRRWDFTKGWVMMNAMQMYSYNVREGDYNDFHLIDRGGGNGDLDRNMFTALASWGVMRIEQWDKQVLQQPYDIYYELLSNSDWGEVAEAETALPNRKEDLWMAKWEDMPLEFDFNDTGSSGIGVQSFNDILILPLPTDSFPGQPDDNTSPLIVGTLLSAHPG